MSITSTGNEIIKKAKEAVEQKYGNAYTGFALEIGKQIIKVKTYSHDIVIKRWSEGEFHHNYYSVFTGGSWYSGLNEKELDILKIGLNFAFDYMREYAKFKKMDGFFLVQEKDSRINDSLKNILVEMDKGRFSEEQRNQLSTALNYYVEEYLASEMREDLEHFFKQAYDSSVILKEIVENNPLCILGVSPYTLMKMVVHIKYHGEDISLIIQNEGDNRHSILAVCNNLNKEITLSFPLKKDEFNQVLEMVEEENKVKNLIKPTPYYFRLFINKVFDIYNHECIEREFGDLVAFFENDWTKVEILFKELYPRIPNEKSWASELIAKYTESNSQADIKLYKVIQQTHAFWFVKFEDFGGHYKGLFKVFVEEKDNEPKEAKAFILNYLAKSLDLKF